MTACSLFQRKGPIAQETSRLQSSGEQLKADGEKAVSEGVGLQNRAKELRVLVEDKRRQAALIDAQGNAAAANQLRLEANSQEAEATAAESKGLELESQGREMERRGEAALRRGGQLEERSEEIERKEAN